jgi:hypothetical protein
MTNPLPAGAFRQDLTATYNLHTIPRELRRPSRLPPETWGLVVVSQGEITLHVDSAAPRPVVTGADAVIPPRIPFHLADNGQPVLFHIEYFHELRALDAQGLAAQLGSR